MGNWEIIGVWISTLVALIMAKQYDFVVKTMKSKYKRAFWIVLILLILSGCMRSIAWHLNFIGPELSLWVGIGSNLFFAIWASVYLHKMHISNAWMSSSGNEIEDAVFFDMQAFVKAIMFKKKLDLNGMSVELLDSGKDWIKVEVNCLEDVQFPWHFHFGQETFEVVNGGMYISTEWSKKGEKKIVHNLQVHRIVANAGTVFRSKLSNLKIKKS